MTKYLGTFEVKPEESPIYNWNPFTIAMMFIEKYGGIDGAHHKNWVLDQVARIYHGTPVITTLAKWDDGQYEYRYVTSEPSKEYNDWVLKMRGEFDTNTREYEYEYDEGIAP